MQTDERVDHIVFRAFSGSKPSRTEVAAGKPRREGLICLLFKAYETPAAEG